MLRASKGLIRAVRGWAVLGLILLGIFALLGVAAALDFRAPPTASAAEWSGAGPVDLGAARVLATGPADLYLSSLGVSTTTSISTTTFFVTVQNMGQTAVGSGVFTTSLFVDPSSAVTTTNSPPSSTFFRIDLGMPALAVNATANLTVTTSLTTTGGVTATVSTSTVVTPTNPTFTWSGTSPQLAAGSHTVTAFTDFTPAVTEADEMNNARSASFTVVTPPNLSVSTLSVQTTNSISTTTFVVGLANGGATATGPFTTTLFVDPSSAVTTTTLPPASALLTVSLGLPAGIAANGTAVITATTSGAGVVAVSSGTVVTAATSMLQIPTGSHSVTAYADFTDAVSESVDTDNYRSASFTVLRAPDLAITSVSASASSGTGALSVNASISNVGGQAAAASTVRLFVDPLSAPSQTVAPSSLITVDVPLAALAAGATTSLVTTTLPAVGAGPHTIWAVADFNDVLAEDNATTGNNVASNTFIVAGGNVLLKLLQGSSSTVRAGTQTQFTLTVQMEAGTTNVDAVELHLDFDQTSLKVVDPSTGASASSIGAGELGALSNTANNATGKIDYVWATAGSPVSGTKILATIPFSTTATAPSSGSTTVSWDVSAARRTDVLRAVDGGSTSVLQRADTATVRIGSNSVIVKLGFPSQRGPGSTSSRYSVPVTVTLLTANTSTEVYSSTLTTNSAGTATYADLAGGLYDVTVGVTSALTLKWQNVSLTGPMTLDATGQPLRYGDANNDGTINITDFQQWLAALFSVVGGGSYDVYADFDGNGVVNITDFIMWKENLGRSGPVTVTRAPSSALADTNRTVVPVKLSIPTRGPINVGQIFYLPVQIDAESTAFDAAELHLNYDPRVLRVVDPNTGAEATSILAGDLVPAVANRADNTLGRIDFAWATLGMPASGSKVLARIPFKAIGPMAGSVVSFGFGTDVQAVRAGSVLGDSTGTSLVSMPAGWTLMALPQGTVGSYTAARLVDELAAQGIAATQVTQWQNGAWKSYLAGFESDDFSIRPSSGYFVKLAAPGTWSAPITMSATSAPTAASIGAGWTSFSLSRAVDGVHTASSLLDDMAAQGVQVSQIERWENGRWENFRLGVPANDFAIEPGRGYFINATNEGVWTPRTGPTP